MTVNDPNDTTPFSKGELQHRMRASYDSFNEFIAGLSDEQLTVPTDAAGWTAKDHLAHLGVWTDGMTAALNRQPRAVTMGFDPALWDLDDPNFVEINEVIRRQHQAKPLSQVKDDFHAAHAGMVARIEAMDEAELLLPYVHYQPGALNETEVVWAYIIGNTYGHYEEHQPWIAAIAAKDVS